MKELSEEIRFLANSQGIDLVGIGPAEGYKPSDVLSDAKSIVVLAIKTPDHIVESGSPKERKEQAAFAEQEMYRVGYHIAKLLFEKGFIAYPVSANSFSIATLSQHFRTPEWLSAFEKHPSMIDHLRGQIPLVYAGYKAGLGIIGRSGLLITPQFGPRVHIGALVTNAPLETSRPLEIDFCENCDMCEKACVGKSISEKGRDPIKCWRAEWEKGEPIPGFPFKLCPALCLKNCPVGKPGIIAPPRSLS